MTDERWRELMDDDRLELTAEEVGSGWHWCVEMDGLLSNCNDPLGDCFCELNKGRKELDPRPSLNVVPFEVSKCCDAAVRVVGSDEGTNHWECLKCGGACDVIYLI